LKKADLLKVNLRRGARSLEPKWRKVNAPNKLEAARPANWGRMPRAILAQSCRFTGMAAATRTWKANNAIIGAPMAVSP